MKGETRKENVNSTHTEGGLRGGIFSREWEENTSDSTEVIAKLHEMDRYIINNLP